MILDVVLAPLLLLLEAVVSAWPGGSPVRVPGVTALGQYLGAADVLVDVRGPLAFLAGLLSVVPALLAVRVVTWLWRLTPGKFS